MGRKAEATKTHVACRLCRTHQLAFNNANRKICSDILGCSRYHVDPRSNATKLSSTEGGTETSKNSDEILYIYVDCLNSICALCEARILPCAAWYKVEKAVQQTNGTLSLVPYLLS